MNKSIALAFSGALLTGLLSTQSLATSCSGHCGTLGPDGVVTASPGGVSYNYVSTESGISGVGQIAGAGGTNGSQYTTNSFTANAGDKLEFYFNYVTADGSGFADYAWAAMTDLSNNVIDYLFTARTQPVGDTSPGFGLPANAATLTPATSGIIGGGPVWSPLGASSGTCYDTGCGYTGWIKSEYIVASAGTYQLVFGVTNFGDDVVDSGLAFNGSKIDGKPIDPSAVPLPAAFPLLLVGLIGLGAFGRRARA